MLWLILGLVLLLFIYLKIYNPLHYWREKGVPYVKPWPIFGSMAPTIFRMKPLVHLQQDIYHQFSDHRYLGFFQFSMPSLMVRDPDLIKQICIKDFDKFTDRTDFIPEDVDPFWKRNLASMSGENWHDMRVVLSPAFTSSKMKAMFRLMVECSEEFVKHFQGRTGTITLEMKDVFTRLANDIIASTAFGIKCDSLKYRGNEFYLMGKSSFNFDGIRSLKFFGYAISATLMKLLKVTFIDEKMTNFFRGVVRQTIKHRDETGLVRPDMIHLLREAQKGRLRHEDVNEVVDFGFAVVQESDIGKRTNRKKREITEEDITAQGVLFFLAGFDTVAVLLCHLAYELAVNPDIQERLVEEVDATFDSCGGKITYEALLGMKYLDMVVSETLRLWSPAAFLNRKCVKPYTIEPLLPTERALHIEPDTDIMIPIFAIHRDPSYYTNPNKFDPERFSDENKHNIHPGTYMPFGIGPRNCIGNRLALLEAKTAIFFLLSQFKIVPVEKTQIPFVINKKSTMIIMSDNGYWLGLQTRSQNCGHK